MSASVITLTDDAAYNVLTIHPNALDHKKDDGTVIRAILMCRTCSTYRNACICEKRGLVPDEGGIPLIKDGDPDYTQRVLKQAEEGLAALKAESDQVVPSSTPTQKRSFRELAEASVRRGEPRVLPIAIGGKNPLIKWKGTPIDTATSEEWANLVQAHIDELSAKFVDANCCVVAKPTELVIIDEDDSEKFRRGYEEWSGEKFQRTYSTSARTNRLQSHWLQTDATRRMGNVSQQGIGIISVRQHNYYALVEGSQHKNGTDFYQCVDDSPVASMPDKLVEYILFLRKRDKSPSQTALESVVLTGTDEQKLQQFLAAIPDESIPFGEHDDTLASIAGTLHNRFKMGSEDMFPVLVDVCERCCAGYGSDYQGMCRKIADSIGRYEIKPAVKLELNQKPTLQTVAAVEAEDLPVMSKVSYPVFPEWTMRGTSLYTGLVEPICKVNNRIPYFLFLPAMQLLINYVAPKIKIKGLGGASPFKGGLYTILIGQKGKAIKSSSAEDAQAYFNYCGLLSHANRDTKSAEGKILVFTAGSSEGLGLDLERHNCKNGLLYFDELQKLVAKASIESSSLSSDLLTMYESGKFANTVKAGKEKYSLEPNSYVVSFLACTTNKKFDGLWAKLAGKDSGLDDRFMFVLEPEKLPDYRLYEPVNTFQNSQVTRRLIDKAVEHKEYAFEDHQHPALVALGKIENRYAGRADRWALGFAVDLGLDVIDSDCLDRACAIVQYEIDVKNYLRTVQAETREALTQIRIRKTLEKSENGVLEKRDLERKCHAERIGTSLWNQAYKGLKDNSVIREEGAGTKKDPTIVRVLRLLEVEED